MGFLLSPSFSTWPFWKCFVSLGPVPLCLGQAWPLLILLVRFLDILSGVRFSPHQPSMPPVACGPMRRKHLTQLCGQAPCPLSLPLLQDASLPIHPHRRQVGWGGLSGRPHLSLSAQAAFTKYPSQGGCKPRRFISSQFWSLEARGQGVG